MASELNEEWRTVAEYEGMYEVSSSGRVRSLDRYRVGDHGAPTSMTHAYRTVGRRGWKRAA